MDKQRATVVVESVMAAWDWEMAPETFDLWVAATEALSDPEAAEVAVIELFGHASRRPAFADVRAAYETVVRRWASEQPTLPAADPSQAWSIEGARRLTGTHRIGGTPWNPMLIPDKEIERAERNARNRWLERGLTHQERVASVKADMMALADDAGKLAPTNVEA